MYLISRFTGDPTVGILRDKKEGYSMRRALRVGSSFKEFRKTPRGRGFILLEFYTLFKCIYDFELIEVMSDRLIGPKSWNRIVVIFEAHEHNP